MYYGPVRSSCAESEFSHFEISAKPFTHHLEQEAIAVFQCPWHAWMRQSNLWRNDKSVFVSWKCSGEDAYKKIRAGATLVQLYTALAYEGPIILPRIKVGDLLNASFKNVYRVLPQDLGIMSTSVIMSLHCFLIATTLNYGQWTWPWNCEGHPKPVSQKLHWILRGNGPPSVFEQISMTKFYFITILLMWPLPNNEWRVVRMWSITASGFCVIFCLMQNLVDYEIWSNLCHVGLSRFFIRLKFLGPWCAQPIV